MSKNSGLGKGLSAIFAENDIQEDKGIQKIRITLIEPKKDQPRKIFDSNALSQLAESIAANGVLQPILVRESLNGFYQIIAGERRWRAAKLAGLNEIPAIIIDADELKAAQFALIENIQRENLNAYEEAEAYRSLIHEYGLTQEEVSAKVGKNRSTIANSIRLLDLPKEVTDYLKEDKLTAGHCRAILGLQDKSKALELANKVIKRNMSVRETENAVKAANRPSKTDVRLQPTDSLVPYIADLEKKVRELSNHKILISTGAKKYIKIDYTNNKDLEELLEKICGQSIIEKE